MPFVETKALRVTGMHCAGCEQRVTRVLEQLPGVKVLCASHEADEVEVRVNTTQTTYDEIRQCVAALGYEVAE
jgi:copper chaperone CopZ